MGESESRSIALRPYINAILSKLAREDILSPDWASSMRQRAKNLSIWLINQNFCV